jgi:hypothetical protein
MKVGDDGLIQYLTIAINCSLTAISQAFITKLPLVSDPIFMNFQETQRNFFLWSFPNTRSALFSHPILAPYNRNAPLRGGRWR